jgi:hypothetical protein
MSGMGGLNQANFNLICRTKQLTAMLGICTLTWINSVMQICSAIRASYNQLVSLCIKEATFLKCGKIMIAFSTTFLQEIVKNTRDNDLGHSKNEKDLTIRSQAPKCANASIWRRFRDYNGVGLRKLATFDEDLRDSPSMCLFKLSAWLHLLYFLLIKIDYKNNVIFIIIILKKCSSILNLCILIVKLNILMVIIHLLEKMQGK